MKKIQFLFTGNFEIDGRDRHFEKGETFDASDKDADRLVIGLCAVEVVEDLVIHSPRQRKVKQEVE